MKQLKIKVKNILPLLLVSVLFFVFGNQKVQAEDAVVEVSDFKSSNYTKDDALLFVQDSSAASQELLKYIDSIKPSATNYFKLNVVNVPKSGDVYDEFKALYDEKCGVDTLYVPTMIYLDSCIYGFDEIAFDIGTRFALEVENSAVKERIAENVDVFNEAIENYNKSLESKTFIDWVKELDTTVLVLIIACVILVIVSFVLIFVFKDKIFKKTKSIILGLQVFFMVTSLGYLTYKVNDTKSKYTPLNSFACDYETGAGCATYAQRVAAGVNAGSSYYQGRAEQMRKDEELFKNNAAHIVAQNAATQSAKVYTQILNMKEGEYIEIAGKKYSFDKTTGSLIDSGSKKAVAINDVVSSSGGTVNDIVVLDSEGGKTGKVISAGDFNAYLVATGTYTTSTGTDGKTTTTTTMEAAKKNAFEKVKEKGLCSLDSGKTLIDCNSKPDECKSVSEANSRDGNCIFISISVDDATGKIYQVIGTTKMETDYYARFDAATGTAVIVPTGKANVDKCEGGEGNNITSSILCNCGSVWTSALTGTCDQVCRVESLVCDRCNPPVSEPPVIVPSNPSNPYCGDGILGNTSGEQCEKGDPSGVKCSWNTCSNTTCKCPTVTAPYCGDGVLNVAGEQCEVGDPSGAIYKWADCNHTNCKGVVSGCGDGKLDAGEKCEKGDPTGYTCKWDECNQLKCQCVEPECGDGKLDTGEKCEKGNPTGSTCLWDECNKSSCTCEVKEVESCGDGKLQDNEQCEEGNPSGASCTWDKCSKSTCLCPIAPVETYPQTSIFESSYMRNIIIGGTLLILGILLYPMAQFIDNMYITVGNKALKIGRYVTRPDEVNRNRKKKKIEDSFK